MNAKPLIIGMLLTASSLFAESSNVWEARAPAEVLKGRAGNPAIWTGKEMIVFGGEGLGVSFADGARYNPSNDSWNLLPPRNAPSSRTGESAVWTGKEFIVWGGFGGIWGNDTNHNDGARFNPATGKWKPMSTKNAPAPRFDHTAVWTGKEMLVWGGYTDSHSRYQGGYADAQLASGGRYDPATDSWKPINRTGAPSRRCWHTAIWNGREMIVWGGGNAKEVLGDGGRYDPETDTWKPINSESAPRARMGHVAVFMSVPEADRCNGDDMIVWGGCSRDAGEQQVYYRDGARYHPATDTWTAISKDGAPKGRVLTKAVWTGKEMIIWGGVNDADAGGTGDSGRYVGTGARYNPFSDKWEELSSDGAPSPRLASGVWTGSNLLLFGGYNGAHLNDTYLYKP